MNLAVIILALSLVAAVVTPLPTSVVLFVGALAMVLTGCLTMEDAYQAIEWRSVFLVAASSRWRWRSVQPAPPVILAI